MGIAMGLAAAFCWGVADFLARQSTQRIGTYRTLMFMQMIGCGLLSIYLGASGGLAAQSAATAADWGWAALMGTLNVLSTLALYRAFEIGVLSLVSPISASFGAITVVLALWSGEEVGLGRGLGLALILLGVILAAAQFGQSGQPSSVPPARQRQGVIWALVAAVGYGVAFWLLGVKVEPALGAVVPIWIIRLCATVGLGGGLLIARQPLAVPRGRSWWLVVGLGLLDTLAYLAHMTGLGSGKDQVALVSVLSSLFSTVTVAIAWLVLRERLLASQWAGIAVIFAGITLVSL